MGEYMQQSIKYVENEIWVNLWHFGMRFMLLFKDEYLVSYDQK